MAEQTVYELVNPQTVVLYDAWGVYKDYDGNAPNGPVHVLCASEELATAIAECLTKNDAVGEGDEEDDGVAIEVIDPDDLDSRFVDFPWAYAEGHEWSSSYKTIKTTGQAHEIARSYDEAITKLVG